MKLDDNIDSCVQRVSGTSIIIIVVVIIPINLVLFRHLILPCINGRKNPRICLSLARCFSFYQIHVSFFHATQVLMREMISVHIAEQDTSDAHRSGAVVNRIRDHIWTKRSKIQKTRLPAPVMQIERPPVEVVPHFFGRSRFVCNCVPVYMSASAFCFLTLNVYLSDLYATSHAVQRHAVVRQITLLKF